MTDGGAGPYGSVIAEHFRRPRNQGSLPDATASAEVANPLCGDRIRVAVLVDGGQISEARFVANACAICVAAASLLTEHVRGMPTDVAAGLGDESVLALVGTVPAGRTRCATLPAEALRRALASA
jgi:nitrogen fixation NifU-like protein